jgi:iron(III) transport system permease protein
LLTTRAALVKLDPALEESAQGLGHGSIRIFRTVVLPQLRPAIITGSLLVGLYTLSDFGAVSLLRYETFTWAIYQQYLSSFDRNVAALLSLVLVGLAIALLATEGYFRGQMRYHRVGSGTARAPKITRLGHWKWLGLVFCAGVVLVALALPIAVLSYWLVRGLSEGESLVVLWSATKNSLYVSGLSAVVCSAFSIPVATLLVRYPGLFSRVLEPASFVGYALPGVVVALALVFFGANFATPVYQTAWLLVFAYVVLFFPAALGSTRASLLQISHLLEDAARILGRTPL